PREPLLRPRVLYQRVVRHALLDRHGWFHAGPPVVVSARRRQRRGDPGAEVQPAADLDTGSRGRTGRRLPRDLLRPQSRRLPTSRADDESDLRRAPEVSGLQGQSGAPETRRHLALAIG